MGIRVKERRRGTGSFHNKLAVMILLGFFILCLLVIFIIVVQPEVSSWAAGTLGAIIGYWANAASQMQSNYYGTSNPASAEKSATNGVKTP